MYERTPAFAKSEKAAGCPRLRHRGGGLPGQAARNPELLALLELAAGAPAEKVRAALNTKGQHDDLPIHRALRDKHAAPALVRAMLDASGEAMLGVPKTYKWLPLHYAAYRSRSAAVVEILLARGPARAARAKSRGVLIRTPLVIAESHNTGMAVAEIAALLRAAMQ
jgi:hypothetical protein